MFLLISCFVPLPVTVQATSEPLFECASYFVISFVLFLCRNFAVCHHVVTEIVQTLIAEMGMVARNMQPIR